MGVSPPTVLAPSPERPGGSHTPTTTNVSCQILVSKYHSPAKEPGFLYQFQAGSGKYKVRLEHLVPESEKVLKDDGKSK